MKHPSIHPSICINLTLLFVLIAIIGCKREMVNPMLPEQSTESISGSAFGIQSIPSYCLDLLNPCDDPQCAPFYNCYSILQLAEHIRNDFNWISMQNSFELFIDEMPTPDIFRTSLDTNQLKLNGSAYLASITGFSIAYCTDLSNNIDISSRALVNTYPQLTTMTDSELEQLSNLVVNGLVPVEAALPPRPCVDECKRVGKIRMLYLTKRAVKICRPGGPIGSWICGVIGFVAASQMAINCLEGCPENEQ